MKGKGGSSRRKAGFHSQCILKACGVDERSVASINSTAHETVVESVLEVDVKAAARIAIDGYSIECRRT